MSRSVEARKITTVRYIARPLGQARENGPHLGDLRAFIRECEGLPDEVLVRIQEGSLSESGRRDVTFSATYMEPVVLAAPQDEACLECGHAAWMHDGRDSSCRGLLNEGKPASTAGFHCAPHRFVGSGRSV